jgi:hypothetical protein
MTPRYYGLQETAARMLVRNLVAKPESLRSEVQLYVAIVPFPEAFRTDLISFEPRRIGMIILRVAYGYKVESTEDPMLKAPLSVLENFSIATAPGRWLVDIIPTRELSCTCPCRV